MTGGSGRGADLGAIALCGALGMALALAVTKAHLRTPVAGDALAVRAGVVPVEG